MKKNKKKKKIKTTNDPNVDYKIINDYGDIDDLSDI